MRAAYLGAIEDLHTWGSSISEAKCGPFRQAVEEGEIEALQL